MCLEVRGPAIDEETDGHEAGARYHQRDAELGTANVVIAHLEFAIDTVVDWSTDLCSKKEADAERDIVETTDPNVLVVGVFPERRERGEHEIHETVEIRHVQREGLYDRLSTKEPKRADESSSQHFPKRPTWTLPFGMPCIVASLFAELFGLDTKKFGSECFPQKEEAHHLYAGVNNGSGPENPSPSGLLSDESASNWSHGRSQ